MHCNKSSKWLFLIIKLGITSLYHTPLQYSCLENPMDGGAWKATVHGVAEGRTRLRDFSFTFHFYALEKEMATHSSVLAWWAAVYGVTQSWTQLKWLSSSSSSSLYHDTLKLGINRFHRNLQFFSNLKDWLFSEILNMRKRPKTSLAVITLTFESPRESHVCMLSLSVISDSMQSHGL